MSSLFATFVPAFLERNDKQWTIHTTQYETMIDFNEDDDHKVDGTTIVPLFGDNVMDNSFDKKMFDADNMPIMALREVVLLPGMTLPISVGRSRSSMAVKYAQDEKSYLCVFTQRNNAEYPMFEDLYTTGCVCEVLKELEMPDGSHNVLLQGRRVCRLESLTAFDPFLRGEVSLVDEKLLAKRSARHHAVMRIIRDDLSMMSRLQENPIPGEVAFALQNIEDDNFLINFLICALPMQSSQRQLMLEESIMLNRATLLSAAISRMLAFAKIKHEVHSQTQFNINADQRQHYLNAMMRTIQEEQGNGIENDINKLRDIILSKPEFPISYLKTFEEGLEKLRRNPEQSPEYALQYNYMKFISELPWGERSQDNLNIAKARKQLDHDHYGIEKVKDRILEHLAVMSLRRDMKSPILCLFGPPGVGKTSLGRSIAKALGRQYQRISLGGLHDEAEVRGHRKTYIGAMPGRILQAIQKAGTDNPVLMLDEIDKVCQSHQGDPSSALLEVLDPEQNSTFHDNYLDFAYDLSHVFFIATANSLSTIPAPLRDRMEIIDLSGYLMEEKVEIAVNHLLPKLRKEHGLANIGITLPRNTIEQVILRYTRESGVRRLEKQLAKLMRRIAMLKATGERCPKWIKPEDLATYLGKPDFDPDYYEGNDYAGVVTGLAWTQVGGEILYIESALVPGKGGLSLTGNLGDVMKESAQLALQWIKANADELHLPAALFDRYTVHIHCPEGATPKDGPSAGITMVTSLASTFTQRRVRSRIAMTGEITLRGRVLPIGGVKEKILAAKRAGITDLVLCEDNRKDVEDIKAIYTEGLTFHYVRDIRDVLDYALLPELVPNAKTFNTAEVKTEK